MPLYSDRKHDTDSFFKILLSKIKILRMEARIKKNTLNTLNLYKLHEFQTKQLQGYLIQCLQDSLMKE